ncbi:hypothetical protein, partial [Enterococcus faecium]
KSTPATEQVTTAENANPLMEQSSLQYYAPDFSVIKDAHFSPAFSQGMSQQIAEVTRIIDNTAPANFNNTIVALEKSGQLLGRVSSVFFNLSGT